MNTGLPPTLVPATRVRYGVVALAVLLAMVTYLDRSCIATLAPDIMRDLGLSKDQMSVIYSAFALAYAAFEVPTTWWADQASSSAPTRVLFQVGSSRSGGFENCVKNFTHRINPPNPTPNNSRINSFC